MNKFWESLTSILFGEFLLARRALILCKQIKLEVAKLRSRVNGMELKDRPKGISNYFNTVFPELESLSHEFMFIDIEEHLNKFKRILIRFENTSILWKDAIENKADATTIIELAKQALDQSGLGTGDDPVDDSLKIIITKLQDAITWYYVKIIFIAVLLLWVL